MSAAERCRFFESVGKEDHECATTLSELMAQKATPAQTGATPATVAPVGVQVAVQRTMMAAYVFEATEAWQLSVRPGDVVQLCGDVADDGWVSCVQITKDHCDYGKEGAVPAAFLVEMRENKLEATPSLRKVTSPPKKYKPVAKNLKKRCKK